MNTAIAKIKKQFRAFFVTSGNFLFSRDVLIMLILFIFGVALLMLFLEIIFLAEHIGGWWFPLEVGYCLLLSVAARKLQLRKAKREIRGIVGEEAYFMMFPRELNREIRKTERKLKALRKS